jgi:hypothetical protein
MSNADIIRTFFEFAAAVAVVLCFVFEKKLIAFENRIFKKLAAWHNARKERSGNNVIY